MSGAQRRGTNWTPEEDRRLFELVEAGKSWVFIPPTLSDLREPFTTGLGIFGAKQKKLI